LAHSATPRGRDDFEISCRKQLAVLLAAAAVVAIGLDTTPASAQTKPETQKRKLDRDGRPITGKAGPNVSYQQGRAPASTSAGVHWLDAGHRSLAGRP